MLVYLNGDILELAQARISPEDRAFLFADGLYEAVVARRGRLLFWDEHERRLRAGLAALRIALPDPAALRGVAEELLRRNGLLGGAATPDALVYLQVSRGAAPRLHAFPNPPVPSTVYVTVRAWAGHPPVLVAGGATTLTVADTRWSRCDVKSTSLLANVLAQQQAKESGAHEAIFVRDGIALEGSHSNLFAVRGGEVWTYPACNYILDGITRVVVLELARAMGIPVRLGAIPLADLYGADEVFLTGTTTEVLPVVAVDGRRIGDGLPGPVTAKLREAYLLQVEERTRS
ncbi:MAG TPA: aminotransferase class IV [Thermoanaerobaculia bacterium]|jgi:D-alanine transaminase|nr:aminotransferase class IV [Thermoanaerobaculia bacterium]